MLTCLILKLFLFYRLLWAHQAGGTTAPFLVIFAKKNVRLSTAPSQAFLNSLVTGLTPAVVEGAM
jgi:hypothetical protein